jgi:hypothetical protein
MLNPWEYEKENNFMMEKFKVYSHNLTAHDY